MIELPTGNVNWAPALDVLRSLRMDKAAKSTVREPQPCTNDNWPPDYEKVYEWRRKKLAQIESKEISVEQMRIAYSSGWRGAVRFITHWMDVHEPRNAGTDKPVWMPMILFPKQVELVQFVMDCLDEEEAGLVEKSRTMGASWICINLSIWMWLFWPGSAIGWGSQSQEQVDRIGDMSSLFEKMRQAINRLPPMWVPQGLNPEVHLLQRRLINPANGASITGGIGDKIGRGGRTRIFFLDESAHYERPEMIEASLSETTRVPIHVSSVNGMGNLFHRKREAGVEWFPGAKGLEKGRTRIFVLDWSDHPEYDMDWYMSKKAQAERQGTRHIFAQEIERNYASAVEGVILKQEWIDAAVDAHETIGGADGGIIGALDVADGGRDRNAWAGRRGVVLCQLDEWGERDTARTARRAVEYGKQLLSLGSIQRLDIGYDCIGVGAGVKAEINRLKDEGELPKHMDFIPWNAGVAVLFPHERQIPGDDKSPRNKDLYENLKAQGWWNLSRRFELTYRAVMQARGTPLEGDEMRVFDQSQYVSLSSTLPLLQKLKKELTQPVWTQSGRLRMMVDKTPEGTLSPNLADAVMMAYWPIPSDRGLLATSFAMPMAIPG